MRKILLASDGSDSSLKAIQLAERLLSGWSDTELVVLYVMKNITPPLDTVMPQAVFDEEERVAREIEQHMKDLFHNYRGRIEFQTRVGAPVTMICEAGEDLGADLIIVGSHGRGAIDRLLLGSVSNGVVNHAKTPVLVAR